MRILSWSAALLAVGGSAAVGSMGCASLPERPSSLELRLTGSVDTVAISPVGASADALSDAEAQVKFEGRAIERLEAAGIRVVRADTFDRFWQRYADDVGGVYDVSTGAVDPVRFEIVRDAVYRELVEVEDVDAVLVLRVVVVDTPGVDPRPGRVGRSPEVCGQRVAMYWPGGFSGQSGEFPSLVRSACLSAELFGSGGNVIFSRLWPLESIETYDRQSRAVRPRGERLANDRVLDAAVASVLRPLIEANAPAK